MSATDAADVQGMAKPDHASSEGEHSKHELNPLTANEGHGAVT